MRESECKRVSQGRRERERWGGSMYVMKCLTFVVMKFWFTKMLNVVSVFNSWLRENVLQ